jgi:hypothetical protein
MFYCRDITNLSVSASNKLFCNLTGHCFEIGKKTYRQSGMKGREKNEG